MDFKTKNSAKLTALTDASTGLLKLTQTAQFKKWFGESRVVDSRGQPLVVFHGTQEIQGRASRSKVATRALDHPVIEQCSPAFRAFEMPANGKQLGVHFGTIDQARTFGTAFGFFLAIQTPLDLPDLGTWDYQSVMREARKAGIPISTEEYDQVFNARDNNQALRDLLIAKGFDGVRYQNQVEGEGVSYIAFTPHQIKSATANTGLFDPQNPDVNN